MDGQSKLTRTQSSLLRSSPTIRSSIQSLSSVNEDDFWEAHNGEDPEEEEAKKKRAKPRRRSGSTRSAWLAPVLSMVAFLLSSLFFFRFYLRRPEIPTSENLLLALIFVAATLFFASRNRALILHSTAVVRQLGQDCAKRLGLGLLLSRSNAIAPPVKWFIGDYATASKTRMIREGVEFYSNGDFYEGEFHKGRSNGSGVYNYFVHGRYEGDWIDGRYDGYGIESWARGSRYRGQYRQGLRHGFGVYKFYTGDSYSGEWLNGQSHGIGVQTCSDGSSYVGEFKLGVKHGLGSYHFRNGDRYAGEYFGDKVHGFGVYHFANGHCYEGSWHEGRKQGYGMYTFRSGESRCGQWDAGTLKTPTAPLNDAVLRTVQAARKTAENAMNIRQVDEQVNKSVVAANRAATAARVAAIKAVQNRMDGKFCQV